MLGPAEWQNTQLIASTPGSEVLNLQGFELLSSDKKLINNGGV
jgi:hypothetical protein